MPIICACADMYDGAKAEVSDNTLRDSLKVREVILMGYNAPGV